MIKTREMGVMSNFLDASQGVSCSGHTLSPNAVNLFVAVLVALGANVLKVP